MSARRYPSATCWYASATISASDSESPSIATRWDRGIGAPIRTARSTSDATSHNPVSDDLAAGGSGSGATRRRTVAGLLDGMQRAVAEPDHTSTPHPATWGGKQ